MNNSNADTVLTRRNLASRANAQALAGIMGDEHGGNWAVVDTGDPCRPFIVQRWVDNIQAQPNVISVATADTEVALRFAAAAQRERSTPR